MDSFIQIMNNEHFNQDEKYYQGEVQLINMIKETNIFNIDTVIDTDDEFISILIKQENNKESITLFIDALQILMIRISKICRQMSTKSYIFIIKDLTNNQLISM